MKNWLLAAFSFIVVTAIIGSFETAAQSAPGAQRPKIGLVLSGGGAKGASHVGVIKVLEELGIPIDYIAGTSMGAIVGGLYASGMPSDELAEAIKSIDWADIFDDRPPRPRRDFRRKLDDEGFLVRYKIGFKDGEFQFPRGVINGQKLNLVLRDLSQRAIGISDFDALPIPFRAVASDIETGDAVVLSSGDLVTAMRASMAVSGAFPPVQIDGRLLVDGGLANNVPIDVARKMGANILIVVGFPQNLKTRRELKGAFSIVTQSLNLLISQNSRLQLKTLRSQDIYIEPALGNIGATDFGRAVDAIRLGEVAARAAAPRLGTLKRASEAPPLRISVAAIPDIESVKIDFIRIENRSRLSDSLISARLRQKPGDTLNIDELEKDIADIYGLDYFETVEYQVVIENDKTGIVVTATERATGLDSFRFGLNLATDFDGDSDYNLSVRYQKEGINELGGEIVLETILGEKLGATAVVLQPLDPATRYFINGRLSFLAEDVFTYEDGRRVSEVRVNTAEASVSAARQLAQWGIVSLGVDHGYGWTDINTGSRGSTDENFDIGAFFADLQIDTLDNLDFPRSGTKGLAEFRRSTEALGGDDDFSQVVARLSGAYSWGRDTILIGGRSAFTFDGTAPTQNLFALGGLFNLSGFLADELTGQNFTAGGLVYYRNIWKSKGLIQFPVYIGASLEAGNVWENRSDISFDGLLFAGSVFLGVDTPLGPVYLAYGHAEGGNDSVYFFLGQTF